MDLVPALGKVMVMKKWGFCWLLLLLNSGCETEPVGSPVVESSQTLDATEMRPESDSGPEITKRLKRTELPEVTARSTSGTQLPEGEGSAEVPTAATNESAGPALQPSRQLAIFAAPAFNQKGSHAASELASYLQQISQQEIQVMRALDAAEARPRQLLVVGSATENVLAADLETRGLLSFDRLLPAHPDGFIIHSVQDQETSYVILAGRSPLGTLYAVYHYLETYCGVGFFEDGEYVPRSSEIPLHDIHVVEWPRFDIRLHNPFTTWIRDLKRVRGTFWTAEEWKCYFDFLVKNKQNWSRYEVCDMQGIGYGWFVATYPEIGQAPDTGVLSAWWPPEYVLQTTQQSLDYGRSIGMKFMYTPVVQFLPEYARATIQQEFPDAVIRDPDPAYRMTTYIIDTPGIQAYLEKNIQSMLKYYGKPDAISTQFPVFEREGAAEFGTKWDPQLFNLGSQQIHEHLPETKSFIDGWGLAMRYKNPDEWQKQLVAGMEYPVVWTSQYPWLEPDPYHEQMEHFRGQPWMYWEIDSFGGRDYLHSFIPYQKVLEIAHDILGNPLSNCIGYGTQAEMIGYDPFVRYLYMKLAWDPLRYAEIETILAEYVAHRYGAESQAAMLQSHGLLVDCLSRSIPGTAAPYSGSDGAIYREARQVNYSAVAVGWPLYTRWDDLEQLRAALEFALQCQQRERDNLLYAQDLARLFQSYAAKIFAFSTVRCYSAYAQATQAFQAGAASEEWQEHLKQFDEDAVAMTTILELLEGIWQTQPELSLDHMINQVTSVPGTAPGLAKSIRGHCAGFFNECYEVMRDFYRPQLKIILEDLRERLENQEKELIFVRFGGARNWDDHPDLQWVEPPLCADEPRLYPKLAALHQKFTSEDYQPRQDIRRGDTITAVVASLRQLDDLNITPAAFQDMATEALIREKYPLPVGQESAQRAGYGGVVTSRASAEAFDQGERIVLGKDRGFQGTYVVAPKVEVDFVLDETRRIKLAQVCLDINAYNAAGAILQQDISVIVNGKKHVFVKSQTRQMSLLGKAKICEWDGLSCFEIPRDFLVQGRNTITMESGGPADGGDEVYIAIDDQGNPVLRLVLELEKEVE